MEKLIAVATTVLVNKREGSTAGGAEVDGWNGKRREAGNAKKTFGGFRNGRRESNGVFSKSCKA